MVGDPNRGFDKHQPGAWNFNILPFIEQQALYDMGKGLTGAALSAANKRTDHDAVGRHELPHPPTALLLAVVRRTITITARSGLLYVGRRARLCPQRLRRQRRRHQSGVSVARPRDLIRMGDAPGYPWPNRPATTPASSSSAAKSRWPTSPTARAIPIWSARSISTPTITLRDRTLPTIRASSRASTTTTPARPSRNTGRRGRTCRDTPTKASGAAPMPEFQYGLLRRLGPFDQLFDRRDNAPLSGQSARRRRDRRKETVNVSENDRVLGTTAGPLTCVDHVDRRALHGHPPAPVLHLFLGLASTIRREAAPIPDSVAASVASPAGPR